MNTSERRELARQQVLAACLERFPAPEFDVQCDGVGTVWVKHVEAGRSVGIQPWQLRGHSVEEVLERSAERLGL